MNKPRTGDGGNTGNAPAHPVPPPPPEPPPKQVKTKITDKNSIAEGFNNYYTSIGNKLSSQIKDQNFAPDFDFQTHVKQSKSSLSFKEVSTDHCAVITEQIIFWDGWYVQCNVKNNSSIHYQTHA